MDPLVYAISSKHYFSNNPKVIARLIRNYPFILETTLEENSKLSSIDSNTIDDDIEVDSNMNISS